MASTIYLTRSLLEQKRLECIENLYFKIIAGELILFLLNAGHDLLYYLIPLFDWNFEMFVADELVPVKSKRFSNDEVTGFPQLTG